MKEIIDQIGIGNKNKITLTKRSSKVNFWYEDSDRWFINIQTNTDDYSSWIIPKDLERRIEIYIDKGYKLNTK